MSDIPGFPYALLWEERRLLSVANLTREDAREFLALAATLPLTMHAFPMRWRRQMRRSPICATGACKARRCLFRSLTAAALDCFASLAMTNHAVIARSKATKQSRAAIHPSGRDVDASGDGHSNVVNLPASVHAPP